MTTPAPTDLAPAVAAIVADQLGIEGPLHAATDLRTLDGVDSLRLLRLVTRIEEHFGVQLDDAEVFDTHTVGALADLVRARVRA
ncbi:acyl carrier protein [Actinomycetospora sp. NBRC 106378]|uniref:acyl carrier protein n=1 Tax=Actinomycetospora sp. NBRC 106378 TaxID=3032208 RepID=UPI0024A306CA|nr:acyl carrier protein [Actinomycetospora sp. NBRC 106378]GLZ52147.1 hypothetical protein Acsp07_17640 [Actinomycetospora sp. NBRC 106378]